MSESIYSLENFRSLTEEDNKIHECINKIMGTLSFRKLAGKTQVILSINGPDIRTRLTHTMGVARIARDLCRDLKLNADLAEAIALAHDIGHTPFGHVGERTLRDIMCGCNTLDGKVSDDDFENAGFKHNLQSFRVLKNLEKIVDVKKIWPYILWGALVHTNMTYAKRDAGTLDNDIFISGFLCKKIYNCYFDEDHECRRNRIDWNNERAQSFENISKKLCKPWYCAILPEDNNGKFYDIENIKCFKKCYISKLWKNKIDHRDIFFELQFLFDHPFPNIFYADYINDYFLKQGNDDWVSLEAYIVKQADEIAQQQQDLEDAINKNLMPIEDALAEVEKLMKPFNQEKEVARLYETIKEENDKISQKKGTGVIFSPSDLGEIILEFYKCILKKGTRENVRHFLEDKDKIKENIYILMDYIYRFYIDNKEKRRKWILTELQLLNDSKKINKFQGNDYFDYSDSEVEERHALFEIASILLDEETKQAKIFSNNGREYEYDFELLTKLTDSIFKIKNDNNNNSKVMEFSEKLKEKDKTAFLKTLDLIDCFIKSNKRGKEDNEEKEEPRFKLKLFHFYILNETFKQFNKETPLILDMTEFLKKLPDRREMETKYTKNKSKFFLEWKKTLKFEVSKIFENLIDFTDNYMKEDNKQKELEEFKKSQTITIIHSEIVEKNDGKASYILRRLFKAYITNPHQLPDLSLEYILIGIQDAYNNKNKVSSFDKDMIKTLKEKLKELRPTFFMTDNTNTVNNKIDDIINYIENYEQKEKDDDELLKKDLSNEVKAVYEEAKELKKFLSKYYYKDGRLKEDDIDVKERRRIFRGILDNTLLRAIPMWKTILTRGICDHIAGMTDQEAIIEYEKLYTGMMELV